MLDPERPIPHPELFCFVFRVWTDHGQVQKRHVGEAIDWISHLLYIGSDIIVAQLLLRV